MATLKNKQTAKKAQMIIDTERLNELMGMCHTSYQEIRQENEKLKEKLKLSIQVNEELRKENNEIMPELKSKNMIQFQTIHKLKEENKKLMETECELSEEICYLKKEKERWEDRFKQKCAEGRRPLCLKQIDEYKKENQKLKDELQHKSEVCVGLQRLADEEHIRYLDIQVKASEQYPKLKNKIEKQQNKILQLCSEKEKLEEALKQVRRDLSPPR